MKKNIIIFRLDRLGDFIIMSSILQELKNRYKNSKLTIICSKFNYKIIKSYEFIDKIIVYDDSFNLIKKIKIFLKINKEKYFISFNDGRPFSIIANIFLKSKFKLGFLYIYKSFLNINYYKVSSLINFFILNQKQTLLPRKLLNKKESLIKKYLLLFSIFKLNINHKDKYLFFNKSLKVRKKYLSLLKYYNINKFLIIHFDEKWLDVKNIENDLIKNLIEFQKIVKVKLILTSFNNDYNYFINIKNFFYKNRFLYKDKIILLENLNIFLFEKFLHDSLANISCHSGFVAQVSGANTNNIIDIINLKDFSWYSFWKPLNTFHKFVYKSNMANKIDIKIIFKKIFFILNKHRILR